jgi:predicted ATPase/signal transduction histidine kinase/CheY-like chemotaxis protein
VQAFRSLVRRVLAEDAAAVAAWRSAALDAVGSNGQVLVDVLPELEVLIGPQEPACPLGPRAALNRFGLVLGRFVSVFARPEHPLVVFLDDLQWADDASLDLLSVLFADTRHGGLLIVGAYRDNEVGPEHRLHETVGTIADQGGSVSTLVLEPLGVDSVARWLRDCFGGTEAACADRAELLVARTAGNPFFLTRLVALLQEDGALVEGPGGWAWDDSALARHEVTDNVVELLSRRLRTLAPDSLEVLQIAACLGARTSVRSIAVAAGRPLGDVAEALQAGIAAGLLLASGWPSGTGAGDEALEGTGARLPAAQVAFLHDRVQQAAYASISPDRLPQIQHAVGQRLLEEWEGHPQDEGLFAVVDHLNAAASCIVDPAERLRLARLDLRAARVARSSGGYDTAAALLDRAMDLGLTPSSEDGLLRALHLERGVNRAQLGRGEEANIDFAAALALSADVLDRADVRAEWIQGLLVAANYLGVLEQGLAALEELGVDLPPDAASRQPAGLALLEETTADLDLAGIQALADLPPIVDPVSERVATLLSAISPSAHMTDGTERWFVWVAFRGLKLFREQGNSAASCHGYSLVGMTLCAIGDVERGVAFHRLAMALADRFGDLEQRCRVGVCFGFHQPWRESLHATLETARRTWERSLEAGDWFNAQWSAVTLLRSSLHRGASLQELREAAEDCGEFLAHRGPEMAALSAPMIQLVDHLSGASAAEGPYAAADTAWFDRLDPLENEALRVWSQIPGLLALLLDGRDAEVVDLARRIWPRYEVFRRFGGGELHLLLGLAAARLARHDDALRAEAEAQLEGLQVWAAESPPAYAAKALLLGGAVLEACGDPDSAIDAYLKAIDVAARDDLRHIVALASLAAADLQEKRGHERYVLVHRLEARHAFARWGALQLAARVRVEAPGPSDSWSPPGGGALDAQLTWSSTSARALDVDAVLEVAEALASVGDPRELLRTILEIAVENAGADAASLVRLEADGLRVRARWSRESAPRFEVVDLPVQEAPFLCLRAAHYVARTGAPLVVADAADDPRFASDEHVVAAGVRSLLGLPLRRAGSHAGLLLLENRLIPAAFTHERVRVLSALSAQLASAMDNARFVAQLQGARDDAQERGESLQDAVQRRDRDLDGARQLQAVVLDSLTEGVCGLAEDGAVVLANPAAHALLGVAPGGLLGQLFHDAFHPEGPPEGCALCGASRPRREDTTFRRTSGASVRVECVARSLPSSPGGVARVLSFRDMGARIESEAQSLQSRKIEAVGQFVAGIAHEFNNLLTPITGHLAWLRDGEPPGTDRDRAFGDIASASARAASLIQQLLAFGRRSAVFRAPVDVVRVASAVLGQLRAAAPDGVLVELDAPDEALWARADADQLGHVLLNLGRNAIEALSRATLRQAPHGRVKVAIRGLDLSGAAAAERGGTARAGRWVALIVSDDGPGIPPAAREHLFEPFFTTRDVGEGSGLGLAVVAGIVKQHGGWIAVEDRVGGGAEFAVFFPRVEPVTAAEPEPPATTASLPRRRVLVVDDESVVRRVATMILEREGYEVVAAEDGRDALAAVERSASGFDLVLLDLSMPGIDGWETLRILRSRGFAAPVLLTSGFNLRDQQGEAGGDAPQPFLPKPFTGAQLLAAVREQLPEQPRPPRP